MREPRPPTSASVSQRQSTALKAARGRSLDQCGASFSSGDQPAARKMVARFDFLRMSDLAFVAVCLSGLGRGRSATRRKAGRRAGVEDEASADCGKGEVRVSRSPFDVAAGLGGRGLLEFV
eukprot:CAMPEP_0171530442 /NCGR_PEP_ID=MMETSP0959-20130129/13085_1 /TAXON_ID=87120 /ORGANISM="Aurantiochytrium limacinum, Strain ATCCMYA-1381" /LENGTH=120 /DNA_ID=CAMNT_0012073245 /DNA_START=693 /DNA_END=1056 /DNA_ORIENTATION=-